MKSCLEHVDIWRFCQIRNSNCSKFEWTPLWLHLITSYISFKVHKVLRLTLCKIFILFSPLSKNCLLRFHFCIFSRRLFYFCFFFPLWPLWYSLSIFGRRFKDVFNPEWKSSKSFFQIVLKIFSCSRLGWHFTEMPTFHLSFWIFHSKIIQKFKLVLEEFLKFFSNKNSKIFFPKKSKKNCN